MKRLLKVTAIMSSATVIILFFNLLKSKFIAVMLGPSGIGLYGLFISLYTTIVSLTTISTGGSIVKKVAEASSEKDHKKLYFIQKVFSLITIITGLLIGLIIFLTSDILSQFAFGDLKYSLEIKLIGLVVVIAMFANFWQSWLNGLRLVEIIAKIRVYSTVASTLISIILIYLFKIDGIIYSIIIIPIVTFFISGYFFITICGVPKFFVSFKEYKHETIDIFKVGFVLLLIAMLFHVGVYVNRSIISNQLGIESVGIFFAAWTISMSYLEIFLSSLSVDYYPRLSENKGDIKNTIKIVNEQLFFSLLISLPLIILIYIYAPLIITVLYSNDFQDAVNILRWQIIGDIFKVFVWIFGFVLIAQNNLKFSLLIQIVWVGSYTLLLFFGLKDFGLEITGVAFLISYFLTFIMSYLYVKIRYNFKFSRNNIQLFIIIIISLSSVMLPIENNIYFLVQNVILVMVVLYSILNMKGSYVRQAQ